MRGASGFAEVELKLSTNTACCEGLSYLLSLIMPPTSKKLEGHIASGLFVRPSVRPFITLFDA